jgi:excisionase family DNA binding protein
MTGISTPAPRLVSIAHAAGDLAISERHLRGLIARGLVPVVRLGRRCLIARTTIDRICVEGIASEARQ